MAVKQIKIKESSLGMLNEIMTGKKNTGHSVSVDNNKHLEEKDTYTIGSEGGNNDYFHVTEGYKYNSQIDLSNVGEVAYSWNFDEDDYQEWLESNELSDTDESRNEYFKEDLTFDVSYFDKETIHEMQTDYDISYSELVQMFGEKMSQRILSDCIERGEGRFETYELYEDESYDVNNPNELNVIAVKMFPHGGYYKDCRGFILTNGEIIYTPSEHNEIQMINGIKSKNHFVKLGNIRILPKSIHIGAEPTSEQVDVLRKIISSYSDGELYLDINKDGESIVAQYYHADWRYVLGEINRLYREGIKPQGGGNIHENIEAEVEASEVKLDSFKPNDILAPKIWNGETLNPKVRLRLLDIADDFWETVNVNWVKRSGIYLTGSICNYNWSKFSDIDLHIVVDFSKVDERFDFVQEYFNGKKNEWNEEHSRLKIYGFPVEVYIEDINAKTESSGIYDLEENKWLKKPNVDDKINLDSNKYDIKSKSAKIMTYIDNLNDMSDSTDDKAVLDKVGQKSHKLMNKIKRMRKFGLSRNGEKDPLNIVYKVLRRSGYMEKLWKLSSELYDKIKSIGLDESEINIFDKAKKIFGTTTDIRECGYILPDGTMLNFSQRRFSRDIPHEKIEMVDGVADKYDFVVKGAIRCDYYCEFIQMFKEPTLQQYKALGRFVRGTEGYLILEISDGNSTADYVEYENEKWNRIINDINNFFTKGIKPSSLRRGNRITEEKSIINEYFKKDTQNLYNYFKHWDNAEPIEKVADLYDKCKYAFKDFFDYLSVDVNYSDKNEVLNYIKNNRLADYFLSRASDFAEWHDLPTWFFMSLTDKPIVKNEWLIHFSNLSEKINHEGFTKGSNDIKKLGLTCYDDKFGEGYDFAFRLSTLPQVGDKYGYDAVIFRASGVEVYHNTDAEKQVIFYGPDAREFIYIRSETDNAKNFVLYDVKTNKKIVKLHDAYAVYEWLTNNYDQYRNHIVSKITEGVDNDSDYFSLAKNKFGVTDDVRECGYILPDGTMLDFTGRHSVNKDVDTSFLRGRRGVDHREIYTIGWSDDGNTKNFDFDMEKFIRMGAIRTHVSNNYASINMYSKPTQEQMFLINKFVRYTNGNVDVEIGDGNKSFSFAEYEHVRPNRIINDIIQYFDNGVKLIGNVKEALIIKAYANSIMKLNEEVVADGNADHNPFKQRWKHEREMLKNYLMNYGQLMTSKENGKTYKVLYDASLSSKIGANYCICIQFNQLTGESGNIIYVRAYDKFTMRIFKPQFDTRGFDNISGTSDDVV